MRTNETMKWAIDPSHTTVEFAVRHLMMTTVKGYMKVSEGSVTLDETDPANSSVEVEIDAASIETRDERRDGHLRSDDFLAVESWPEIRFRSTKVESKGDGEFRVEGQLTIRGVTKPVVLEVTEEGRGRDPWGGERIGYEATTKIDRREWGLEWNQTLETGGLLVGNDVRITLGVEVVKQAAEVAA
jgi:polyisoprenoid-binding protein YceI